MLARPSPSLTFATTGAAPVVRAIVLAGAAALTGLAFGMLGAEAGPWTMVAIPAAALWFSAVLVRPVWAIVAVFVSLPVALSSLPIGGLQVVDVVSIVVVLAMTLAVLLGHAKLRLAVPAFGWGLALCTAGVLAVPGAVDVTVATTRMVNVIVGFLLAIALVAACQRLVDLRILVAALLGAGIVMTLLALQSLSEIRPAAGGLVVRGRATGVFGDPNELGSFTVILLMVGLGTALAKVRTSMRVMAVVATLLATAGLAVSLSRGAWIGAALGVVGLMVLLPGSRRTLVGVLMSVAVLGLAFGLLQPDQPAVQVVRDRLGSVTGATNSPYDRRPEIWAEAVREINERPVFGFGPGTFVIASRRSASESRTIAAVHAHNVLLTVGAESGVPAVGFLVGLTLAVGIAALRATRRLRRAPEGALVAGAAAALFGEVGHGLIDNTYNNPMLLGLMWALTGIVLAGDQLAARPAASASARPARLA
ncbi:MAG TPA: O-antigen ligase family protein [Acidimicrobiia bacterium]|nr:O-antigen ligase family protein [Acidimicrobiia bacterium]